MVVKTRKKRMPASMKGMKMGKPKKKKKKK